MSKDVDIKKLKKLSLLAILVMMKKALPMILKNVQFSFCIIRASIDQDVVCKAFAQEEQRVIEAKIRIMQKEVEEEEEERTQKRLESFSSSFCCRG
uniref:Uncharacterized protein n=1 Tax=Noccaea caerulescens TaxID=107243 RepID=A0A1J3FA36_NOCCA